MSLAALLAGRGGQAASAPPETPAAPSAPPEAAGAPSGQASPDRRAGVFVQVEGWFVSPRNLDLDYAFIDESGSLSGGGDLVTLTPPRDSIPRLSAAWRFAEEGSASVGATFWELDVEEDSDTGTHPGMVGAILASPDFAIGRSLVDRAQASTHVRATAVDAGLSWSLESGRTRVGFEAGLRAFRFEEDRAVTYDVRSTGIVQQEFINTSTDASGLGPRAAISFGYRIGKYVDVGGELGLALPIGDLEGLATDTGLRDLDGDGTPEFDRATVVNQPGTRKAFEQLEGALRVEVRLSDRFSVSASYLYVSWPDVSLGERFVDDLSQNTTLPVEESAVFEGLAVGVRFGF